MARRVQRFGLVNLGCPKNTVDSEGLLGGMALAGFEFTEDPAAADVCLVNTCGFLDASRREAADSFVFRRIYVQTTTWVSRWITARQDS